LTTIAVEEYGSVRGKPMRLGRWLALLLVAAHAGCAAGPTEPSPQRAATLQLVPNPVVGTWVRNVPKFPTSDAGSGSGLSVMTVGIHVGSATGYDYYYGSPYVPAGTTSCLAGQSAVLQVGPFGVDVDLVDDRGHAVRLHADGRVLPPTTPAPAD
jgi:hypothetical protein